MKGQTRVRGEEEEEEEEEEEGASAESRVGTSGSSSVPFLSSPAMPSFVARDSLNRSKRVEKKRRHVTLFFFFSPAEKHFFSFSLFFFSPFLSQFREPREKALLETFPEMLRPVNRL